MKSKKQVRMDMYDEDFAMDARYMPLLRKYTIPFNGQRVSSYDTFDLKEKYVALREKHFKKSKQKQ